MTALVFVFFTVMWVAVAFVVLLWIARRFFHEPRQAVIFSAAVVLAFVAGRFWPAGGGANAPAPTAGAMSALYAGPADVGAVCRRTHFTGAKKGLGNVDGFGEFLEGKQTSEPNGFVAERNAALWIGGWAADVTAKVPAKAVCMLIDGKIVPGSSTQYGIGRMDVASAFHGDALVQTGYILTLPVSGLRRGPHKLGVAVVLTSGEAYALPVAVAFSAP